MGLLKIAIKQNLGCHYRSNPNTNGTIAIRLIKGTFIKLKDTEKPVKFTCSFDGIIERYEFEHGKEYTIPFDIGSELVVGGLFSNHHQTDFVINNNN